MCYNPCDNTLTAATVAVTTGRWNGATAVYRKEEYGIKRIFLQISNDTQPVVRNVYDGGSGSIVTWAVQYRAMSKSAPEFLVAHATSKCVQFL